MVLQSDAADGAAEQQKEIVVVVVMRLIQLVGLAGEVLVLFEGVRRDDEIFFIVGEDVQANDVGR